MTQSETRAIIEDFAKEIARRKTKTAKPSKIVIDFRQEKRDNYEREIVNVPLHFLRYRKENGRITSDVLSYERSHGPLRETDQEAQEVLGSFLAEKDPEKTLQLERLIQSHGQEMPAIITCDGFLIDGNRRRYVLGKLNKEYSSNPDFEMMKVVILPGPEDEGGPPTLLEIEKIENRYQLQSDGKATYSKFDTALSIRKKEQGGFSLEDQLKDDPQYAHLSSAEFTKQAKKKRKEFLEPLDCIDRYLEHIGRPGQYNCVSTGVGDSEGRWQAFVDYSRFYCNDLTNAQKRQKMGVEEQEVGDIEDAAFKVIRLRRLDGLDKVHQIIRNFPKYCKDAKEQILAISGQVDDTILESEKYDSAGEEKDATDQENIWAAKAKQIIIPNIVKAKSLHSQVTEQETPLTLLEAALKKLEHDQMDISLLLHSDLGKARGIASRIQKVAHKLEKAIYDESKSRPKRGISA